MSTHLAGDPEQPDQEVMVRGLLKHLYVDRILPLLPVESVLQTYTQVEAEETFLRCRSVVLDLAVNQNINLVVDTNLSVMELVLEGESVISEKVSTEGIQSIVVLIRLLSDCVEHYWDHVDSRRTKSAAEQQEKQNRLFASSVVGYSTHTPCLHAVAPPPLDPEIAGRMLDMCSRAKFNTNTLAVLLGMSHNLYGNSSVISSNILPNYQAFLRQKDYPEYTLKIDSTLDYLFRFVAASNPLEFSRYIRITVLKPLLENHQTIEMRIIQYIDLFGCYFITSRNILKFLEMIKGLSNSIKKTIYHCYLLLCASKALEFWIMTRPNDYSFLLRSMKRYNATTATKTAAASTASAASPAATAATAATAASSSITTTTTAVASSTTLTNLSHTTAIQPSMTSQIHSSLTSSPLYHNYNDDNTDELEGDAKDQSHSTINTNHDRQNVILDTDAESDVDYFKAVSQISLLLFDEVYSTFNISTLLTAITNYSTSTPQTASSSSQQPVHTPLQQIPTPQQQAQSASSSTPSSTFPFTGPFSPLLSSNIPTSSSPTNMISSPGSEQSLNASPEVIKTVTGDSCSHSFTLDESSNETSKKNNDVDSTAWPQPDLPHIGNVLDLYTTLDENESTSHSAVLKFVIIMSLLDLDVFTELNATSFKNIPDVKKTDEMTYCTEIDERDKEREKEKSQGGMKYLAHGLKKLTILPTSKRKSVKFITMLLRNLNGSLIVSDVAFLDTLRALITFITLTASISLVDSDSPSIHFANRLFSTLSSNLDFGANWLPEVKINPFLQKCLLRNPQIYGRLRIEFFAAAMQLDQVRFLNYLQFDEVIKLTNLKRISLYTEGLRVFFQLPLTVELRKSTAHEVSEFFRTLFCTIPDTLLKAYPYFDEEVTDIITAILDGSILKEIDERSILKEGPLLTPSPVSLGVQSQIAITGSSSSPSGTDNYVGGHSILPIVSSSSSSSETSSLNSAVNISDQQFTNLVAPRARRVSMASSFIKRASLLSSPGTSDSEKGQSGPRSQVDGILSSGLARNTKSPLNQVRSRRASDEVFPKLSRAVNPASITKNLLTTSSDERHDARRIMINIFSIYKRLASFFILPHLNEIDEAWASTDFKNIIKPIFVAIIDTDRTLQKTAISFMDMLINYMPDFYDETVSDNVCGFYLLCSYTVTLFSTALFDLRLHSSKREVVLDIVVKFLQVRSNLAKILAEGCSEDDLLIAEKTTFPLISGTLGRALFVSLYSNKSNVQKLLKTAYFEYHQSIRFHEKTIGELPIAFSDMLAFSEAMSQDNYVASGSVAFQRRLRLNLLKYIKRPDTVLFDSMNVIYKKWLELSRSKDISQEDLADFRSFAGIIASMCGVLLSINDENPSTQFQDLKIHVTSEMNYFISKQCQWLNNPDLLTRENSKDILSMELHPLAFKLLFSNLRSRMEELESMDLSEPKNDLYFVLLEQIIIIIRTIMKRDDDERLLLLFSLDILDFIENLIDIVKKIPQNSSKFYKAVIHMSKMFRAIETAELSLGVAGHYLLKNIWLDLVTNWFKLTVVKDYDFENLHKPHREMDLRRRDMDILFIDTLIESSKALAYLTNNVPLEVPASVSEEELKRSRTVVFGNYFNILLKGLEKSTDLERFPASLKHKISILNENVITSLTNLSNANVDAGLSSCLPMGYSKNNNIRVAFLKVFVNIVSNYSTYKNFSDLPVIAAFNDLLLNLMEHPEFALKAVQACSANQVDAVAAGFVTAYDSRNASHLFVAELLVDEIKKASRHMDILRRNSGATRALSLFSRLKGAKYLEQTLAPVLTELMESDEVFEIEKDSDAHTVYFVKYMTKLVDSISKSVSFFPPELFYICQIIYKAVKEKYPDYAYVAVGSFVFLRFFCPALVSPDAENIVNVSQPKFKRSFISLAKVIQSIANGTDNINKWASLVSQNDFLKDCGNRIFKFLEEICRTDRIIKIPINSDPTPVNLEYNFLHKYLYHHEVDIRRKILTEIKSFDSFELAKQMILSVDKNMAIVGQPKVEFRNVIPSYIIDHMEEYPELYEFMNRHAFRNVDVLNHHSSFVRESMSSDGLPILTLTFGNFNTEGVDIDTIVYRTFQIYARIWPVKHYMLLDCTAFDEKQVDVPKLTSLFASLIPPAAIKNCKGYYYYNVSETFMSKWGLLLNRSNPYVSHKVPHHFINSYTDPDLSKSMGMSGRSLDIVQDVRVSLHDIALFDEHNRRFAPVSLKIGNNYFQVLHGTTRQYKLQGWDRLVDIKINDVYEIANVLSVNVSSTTGVASEFTVNLQGGGVLIFCSSKYLEIVKMFYYALDRIGDEYEYGTESSRHLSGPTFSDVNGAEAKERRQIISHLLLIIWVNLLDDDVTIKSVSYNLMAATQDAFGIDCGVKFRKSPEVYVPSDCSTFLCLLSKSIAKSAPDLTMYMWRYILDGLETEVIPHVYLPQTMICLSYWVPNLYPHVYLMDDEEGPEAISRILRSLIRLTVSNPVFTAIFLQQIWILLALDGRLTSLIVEEVVNHALDRDSESRDWKKALCLFNGLPTVEIASHIIERLMNILKTFLPSFKLETSTQSWSELGILIKTSIPLFFESALMAQMFLPEVLFIVSLLIDVGPNEIRSSLHELLTNVCHSLFVNDALDEEQKKVLNDICTTFSRQRLKFMFGFSQDKGRFLQNFNSSSFSSKFAALEHFTNNIMVLMEYSSTTEAPHWKTRYKKYLIDAVFNSESFLSARAMMILGILGQTSTSEILCRNLLGQTMKVIAEPHVTEELLFVTVAHIFTYGKLVEGLDPSLDFMKHLFWFSTTISDSLNCVIFEGGLLLLSGCLNRLYEIHFENHSEDRLLTTVLIESRQFAKALLDTLEDYGGGIWTEENFSHNLIAIASKGLYIPFIKAEAIECMTSFFKNTFREHQRHPQSTHYLCHMFFLFLFLAPEHFITMLQDVNFEDDFIVLSEHYNLPKSLADWLSSGDDCSSITLYQSALLFNSSISDEPSKLRFALILRFLIKRNPVCVFRIYFVVREELRRISTMDLNSEGVKIAFDIIKLLVGYSEFNDMAKYNEKSIQNIKARGLESVLNIKSYDPIYNNSLANLADNSEMIYHKKRILTMLLSRMTCYI